MLEENRGLMISGAAIVVALVVIGSFLLFRGDPASKVTIASIPNDLTLTLDGHQIAANGEVKVKPGTHTLNATRKGFQPYSQTITVKGGDPLSVRMYLYANNAEGREWASEHPNETSEAEAEAGRRFDEINRRLAAKYPIMASLPYLGPGFKVTYDNSKSDPKNPEAISVVVATYTPDGKQKALEWIQGQGWDPNTLDIIYTVSTN
jgi:hypothetical protein